MGRRLFVVAILTAGLAIAGCRANDPATAEQTAPPERPANRSGPALDAPAGRVTRARIHPELPEFSFTLVGDEPAATGDPIHGRAIEVRRGDAAAPVQVIDGLDTETPLAAGMPAVSVLDMNFDGYGDIRLVEFQPAGPNVPYLHWLFEPASGRFIESPALNAITAPQFDAAAREVRSDWRDGATRYGTDVYTFDETGPALVRKEVREYTGPGRYTARVLRPVDGVWKVVEQRGVREP